MALTKVIGDGLGGTNDLTVDTDTLKVDSTNDKVGINTASPSDYYSDELVVTAADEGGITIVNSTTHRGYLNFADGTSGDARYRGYISYDHNTDDLYLGSGGSGHIHVGSTGTVLMPNQPSFNAILSGHITISTLNAYNDLVFGTERFDQNGDYNTSDGVFTAPITGRYLLTTSLYLFNSLDSAATYYYMAIRTTNETVDVYFETSTFLNSDSNGFNMQASSIQDMSAGDTAKISIYQAGGSAQTQIAGGHSHFSGALIC